MKNKSIISFLYQEYKKRPEIRSLIPMGYVPGYPIMSVENDNLILKVPFLRYKATGKEDQTLVFPIRFVLEYSLPELSVVRFTDLSILETYSNTDFNRAVGFFRHNSIKHLNKDMYHEFRMQTLQKYDKLCNALTLGEDYDDSDDVSFRNSLQVIIEPSLYGFYMNIAIDFYEKYIKQ